MVEGFLIVQKLGIWPIIIMAILFIGAIAVLVGIVFLIRYLIRKSQK